MSAADKQKLGQDVSQTAKPTFAGAIFNDNVDLQGHVLSTPHLKIRLDGIEVIPYATGCFSDGSARWKL
jgi:hypothetical protein